MSEHENTKAQLVKHGCDAAANHLDQAKSALDRGEWESASAQVRSAVEAVFDRVAELRLSSSKRGGEARAALERSSVLSPDQARTIQSFMNYCGKGGSHAGLSLASDAKARYQIGLGLVILAIGVLPNLVRVQDAFSGLKPPPIDGQIQTSCPTCKTEQLLTECVIAREDQDTIYTCKHGCQALVVVGVPGASPWPGRGYRLGDHVVRNASNLLLAVVGSSTRVLIPASPAALMRARPEIGTVSQSSMP
jgi:hypothetical protein